MHAVVPIRISISAVPTIQEGPLSADAGQQGRDQQARDRVLPGSAAAGDSDDVCVSVSVAGLQLAAAEVVSSSPEQQQQQCTPDGGAVPRPISAGSAAGLRALTAVQLSSSPRLLVIDGFFDAALCEGLMELARDKLVRSRVASGAPAVAGVAGTMRPRALAHACMHCCRSCVAAHPVSPWPCCCRPPPPWLCARL